MSLVTNLPQTLSINKFYCVIEKIKLLYLIGYDWKQNQFDHAQLLATFPRRSTTKAQVATSFFKVTLRNKDLGCSDRFRSDGILDGSLISFYSKSPHFDLKKTSVDASLKSDLNTSLLSNLDLLATPSGLCACIDCVPWLALTLVKINLHVSWRSFQVLLATQSESTQIKWSPRCYSNL